MSCARSNYIFLFLCLLFIIYGSLFPLTDLRAPELTLYEIWRKVASSRVSRSDLLTNLLVYIPFGFLTCSALPVTFRKLSKILLATILGTLLSFLMEYLQMYLPARTSSPIDLALNSFSTFIGAMACIWAGAETAVGVRLLHWRRVYFHEGKVAEIGLMALVLWTATQLSPFVPSIDLGDIKNAIKPIWMTIHDLSRFNSYRAVTYTFNVIALGAIFIIILRNSRRVVIWLGVACGMVLLGKIFVSGRQLSLEALTGVVSGVIFVTLLRGLPPKMCIFLGGISVTIAFAVDEIRPDFSQTVAFHKFNWLPFSGQMAENVAGIGSILDGVWPFVALGFFGISCGMVGRKFINMIFLVLLLLMVFLLECYQAMIPGRYPDITTVILAGIGWMIPMLVKKKRF